jgi:hypothetical protein
MSSSKQKYLVGIFDDDHDLLHAVEHIRGAGHSITDAFTPFPVHGLEHAMGLRATRLHTAGFFFGGIGFVFMISFLTWMSLSNYPINFGGKPYFSLLAWVPPLFEVTVLWASIGMTVSYYYLCNMYPGKMPKIIDPRTTDHKFALTFELSDNTGDEYIKEMTALLKHEGASEVFEKEV